MALGSESRNASWDLAKGPSFGIMKVTERLFFVTSLLANSTIGMIGDPFLG